MLVPVSLCLALHEKVQESLIHRLEITFRMTEVLPNAHFPMSKCVSYSSSACATAVC